MLLLRVHQKIGILSRIVGILELYLEGSLLPYELDIWRIFGKKVGTKSLGRERETEGSISGWSLPLRTLDTYDVILCVLCTYVCTYSLCTVGTYVFPYSGMCSTVYIVVHMCTYTYISKMMTRTYVRTCSGDNLMTLYMQ